MQVNTKRVARLFGVVDHLECLEHAARVTMMPMRKVYCFDCFDVSSKSLGVAFPGVLLRPSVEQ